MVISDMKHDVTFWPHNQGMEVSVDHFSLLKVQVGILPKDLLTTWHKNQELVQALLLKSWDSQLEDAWLDCLG